MAIILHNEQMMYHPTAIDLFTPRSEYWQDREYYDDFFRMTSDSWPWLLDHLAADHETDPWIV